MSQPIFCDVAWDFDGVIHKYSKGWHDGTIYDRPMKGAREACFNSYEAGLTQVIYSTRCCDPDGRLKIMSWLYVNKFSVEWFTDITAIKPAARLYVDDRAHRHMDWVTTMEAVRAYIPNRPVTKLSDRIFSD